MPPGLSTRRHSRTSARSSVVYCTTPCAYTRSNDALSERQRLAIGDGEARRQLFEREVLRGERDRRRREIDAGDVGAMARESNQVGARAASDFEHAAPAKAVEGHETRQMVQLFEVILLEIGEEARRARRMRRDVEVVNVRVPVRAHGALGRRMIRTCGHRTPTIRYPRVIRDLPRLAEREFDVLVVGGGIYGLTIAYDAAQRGLSVALIDRGDFGAATSFNHLKTIHGGLRYLQSADFRRMRESIRERRAFARIAPRWIAPLAFAMPTGASLTRNPIAMKAALAIDAFVGRDRNDGVDPARHLPAGRIVAGAECRELFDGAHSHRRVGSGVARLSDHRRRSTDAVVCESGGRAHGAVLANYVEAIGTADEPSSDWAESRARDKLSGRDIRHSRARYVVNAGRTVGRDAVRSNRRSHGMAAVEGDEPRHVTSRAERGARRSDARRPRARAAAVEGRTLVGTSESSDLRQPDDQDAQTRGGCGLCG